MNISDSVQEKVMSAYQLLQAETISIDTFEHVRTILKGIHPEIDKKLATCSELLGKLQKIQSGDVITLSAEALPEDSEEEKKRKKAILLFIKHWRDLKSEVEKIKGELEQAEGRNFSENTSSFLNILAKAKGPFGILTIIAVVAIGGLFLFDMKKSTDVTDTVRKAENLEAQSTPSAAFKVKVIEFNGKKISVSEIIVAQGLECDSAQNQFPHYHAKDHVAAQGLDGSMVQDPGNCGFGKVKDVQIIEVEASPSPHR